MRKEHFSQIFENKGAKFKLWDIEMGGNGLGYPIQKGANLGLNINF